MTDGLIAGRFRVRGLLGAGGTAAVFEAHDTVTGREVALKLLHPHLAARRPTWAAFFEEVHAARSIVHPNLAEVFDAGVDSAEPPVVWIAMELVAGISLAEHVRAHGPLTLHVASAVGAAVLDALAAAHAGGVVHRDVTPSNIMLDPATLGGPFDEERVVSGVRLLDFGLADIPGRTTVGSDPLLAGAGEHGAPEGGVVASAPYASPEQLSGAPVREQSDLYQVGACLYFALTGRAPFPGDTAAIVRGHLSAPPPVPSAVRRGLPRDIDRVVTTAMLKQPAVRYADAVAMRQALIAARVSTQVGTADAWGTAGVAAGAGESDRTTAVTRVYRPAVRATSEAASPAPAPIRTDRGTDEPDRRGSVAWVTVSLAIVAVTMVAGISAMGASREPIPKASASSIAAPMPTSATAAEPVTRTSVATGVVPDLVGSTLTEVRATLEQNGFALGDLTIENAPATADTVLGTSPAAGETVTIGAAIAVRVASGQNLVPDVVGRSGAEARSLLVSAGFVPQPADTTTVTALATVIGSAPRAGAVAPVGSAVAVTVQIAASPTPSVSASAAPSSTPSPTPTPTSTTQVTP